MRHDLRLSWGSAHGSYCLNIEQVGFIFVPNTCISSDSQWMSGSFLLTISSVMKHRGEWDWKEGCERLRQRQESTNTVDSQWPLSAWHTFHHDGKFSPASWGKRVHASLSLYLSSRAKLWCTLQLRGQIHSSYFSSTLLSPLWAAVNYSCIKALKFKKPSHTRLAIPNLLTLQGGGGTLLHTIPFYMRHPSLPVIFSFHF